MLSFKYICLKKGAFFGCIFFLICFSVKAQVKYNNEWISTTQPYCKIKIAEQGIYRISYDEMKSFLNPALDNIGWQGVQLWYHGVEIPILIVDDDGKTNKDDYIEFYATQNDGELDSYLYRPQSARMNPYHSLYTDDASYFLTVSQKKGKRVSALPYTNNATPIASFHLEEQLKVFTDQYSFNLSIGYPPFVMQSFYEPGEGWTGKVIAADSLAIQQIALKNYVKDANIKPQLECLYNGRSELEHKVSIFLLNKVRREIGKIDKFGFDPVKINTTVETDEIRQDDIIQLGSQSRSKDKVEWHSITYYKIVYPQKVDMAGAQEKIFYFQPNTSKSVNFNLANLAPATTVYSISDRYKFDKVISKIENNQLGVRLTDISTPQKIFVAQSVKKVAAIDKVIIQKEFSTADFVIITHQSLLESANQYATYRSSKEGGNYKTSVVTIEQLYNSFSFGERTPLAIQRYLTYLSEQSATPQYLLIVGRGMSYPDRLKKETHLDLIPTIGYPGSDILLSAGLNGYDQDVEGIPTGRISATTNEQVLNYLKKVQEYEANKTDLLWKKNILHLSGGLTQNEIFSFKNTLQNIGTTAKGMNIQAISKQSEGNIENIDISPEVNNGLGLITFLGHSAATTTDLNIGYASTPGSKLQNRPKYPLMYFNGCGVGNIFNNYDVPTTDWLITPNKGAIAILGNTFWSYTLPTNRYLQALYQRLFSGKDEPIGVAKQQVSKLIKAEGADNYMLSNLHQLILQGDPAITLFSLKKPDYQVRSIFLRSKNGKTTIAENDSLYVGVVISNAGNYNPNLELNIQVIKYGNTNVTQQLQVKNVAYQDTIFLPIRREPTLQKIEIMVDASNKIDESDEGNNKSTLLINWNMANNSVIFPSANIIDLIPPILQVFVDNKIIKNNAYIAPNAQLTINLEDETALNIADTTSLEMYIKACNTCPNQKIFYKNLAIVSINNQFIKFVYNLPNLAKGKYILVASAKDKAGNTVANPYQIEFNITTDSLPIDLTAFPNPATDFVTIGYTLSELPKSIELTLIDPQGRILEQKPIEKYSIGVNEAFVNLKNVVSSFCFIKLTMQWKEKESQVYTMKIYLP